MYHQPLKARCRQAVETIPWSYPSCRWWYLLDGVCSRECPVSSSETSSRLNCIIWTRFPFIKNIFHVFSWFKALTPAYAINFRRNESLDTAWSTKSTRWSWRVQSDSKNRDDWSREFSAFSFSTKRASHTLGMFFQQTCITSMFFCFCRDSYLL